MTTNWITWSGHMTTTWITWSGHITNWITWSGHMTGHMTTNWITWQVTWLLIGSHDQVTWLLIDHMIRSHDSYTRLHFSLLPQDELQRARHFLQSMGYKVRSEVRNVPISLSYQEAKEYSKIFKSLDKVCQRGCSTQVTSSVTCAMHSKD